ncbi:MAG: SWIM zinc finger family protein [Nitrospirota bacterium]
MPLPEITEDIINSLASGASLSKGYSYFHGGAVVKLWIESGTYKAHVDGSERYTVTVSEKKSRIQTDCTCPYDWGGACKHIVAAMLAIVHDKKIKKHKKETEDIKTLIEKADAGRLKTFLFEILSGDDVLLEDFKIFAKGKEETSNTSEKYKKEILSQFNKLKGIEYYYDDYHDSYENPISNILDEFSETAEKYASQGNYKEAIKIYQGICDACIKSLQNERLEDFYDDIHYDTKQAFNSIAENISKLSLSLKDKEPYLDYFLQAYNEFEDKEVFKKAFLKIINTPEEADYVLGKQNIDLIPPVILNLLIVKGEPEAVFSFGEKHYKEYPEMAVPLSAFYLKRNQRDKAIATAEEALEQIHGKSKDFRFGFHLPDEQKELREFLDGCYRSESDYPKVLENLIMLLFQERDIAYYKKLKKVIKTEKENKTIIERFEKVLDDDYDLLFKIYSIEDDYERMLKLAKKSIHFDVFNLTIRKIRDRYPDECFELYKKKINDFTKDVKKRDAYRQAAYWLKLMKEIPGTQDTFKKYIEHLREKYKRRPAFIDEIKGI